MKTLKFSIITILLSFITSCNNGRYYIPNDKGVVINIKKVQNENEVTIAIIKNSNQKGIEIGAYYLTFITHKQYNINDTIYLTKIK